MKAPPVPGSLVNIGPVGVARRKRIALGAVVFAVVAVAVLDGFDVAVRWRAPVIIPLWIAALCWLQAAAQT